MNVFRVAPMKKQFLIALLSTNLANLATMDAKIHNFTIWKKYHVSRGPNSLTISHAAERIYTQGSVDVCSFLRGPKIEIISTSAPNHFKYHVFFSRSHEKKYIFVLFFTFYIHVRKTIFRNCNFFSFCFIH